MITTIQQKRRDAIKGLTPIASSNRYQYSIQDVQTGGYIAFDNQNWKVLSLSKYLDVKWSSFKKRKKDYLITELELFSLKSGKITYLEWEFDDELEIYQTTQEIKLKELTFNGQKIKKNVLEDISEEEEGDIKYKGEVYSYMEDYTWAGLYFKDESVKEGIPVRFYEFESNKGISLTVEMWYDEVGDDRPEREAFLSCELSSNKIEILQLKA